MEDLAPLLSISQATLSKIETGKHRPGWETLDAILRVTEGLVTPNDFVAEVPGADAAEPFRDHAA